MVAAPAATSAISRVSKRNSGPSVSSAVAVVRVLKVEAGISGRSGSQAAIVSPSSSSRQNPNPAPPSAGSFAISPSSEVHADGSSRMTTGGCVGGRDAVGLFIQARNTTPAVRRAIRMFFAIGASSIARA